LHEEFDAPAGTILAAGKAGIDVACGTGGLRLLEIQKAGGRRITAAEFAAQTDLSGKQSSRRFMNSSR
jgi:methionyl-tRNA formyltransferase